MKGAGAGRARLTVLVVDDEPLVRRLAVEILDDAGYEVLEASDGLEALAILRERPEVDLLFSDCRMPRIRGPELAAAVRPLILAEGLGLIVSVPEGDNAEGLRHAFERLGRSQPVDLPRVEVAEPHLHDLFDAARRAPQ